MGLSQHMAPQMIEQISTLTIPHLHGKTKGDFKIISTIEPIPVFCIQFLTKGQILGISGPLSPRNNYVISSLDISYTRLSIISSSFNIFINL